MCFSLKMIDLKNCAVGIKISNMQLSRFYFKTLKATAVIITSPNRLKEKGTFA